MDYRCIMADPPWKESGGGKIKRGADRHYPLLSKREILEIMHQEIDDHTHYDGCHLWLWVTDNFLRDGLWLMDELGFRYVRTLQWVKMREGNLQIGLGQYLRGSHEMCLLGRKGPSMVPPPPNRRPSVVLAPRTRHSEKPLEAIQVIETVSPGPRLELFARARREGWDAHGNEV